MVNYLLFDLDNTLYSCVHGLEDRVKDRMQKFTAAVLGVPPEEAWRQRMTSGRGYGTNLEWLMCEKGFTDAEGYLAAVHPPDEADNLPADPALGAFLKSIAVPKAILTNSPMEHADLILDRLGVAGLFTHIFDIRQTNFRGKPRREVFTRALGIMGVRAEEVLFIDDNPSYVRGFTGLGGRGLLLDETNARKNYSGPKIRELNELLKYL
jgi:putative hydrolase of the HAD superfamily